MTNKLLFFFLIIGFLSSCSSDPCENIICVNGTCDDGLCGCEEGWEGPNCDQKIFNFIGTFELISIQYSDCMDGGNDFGLFGGNGKVCNDTGDVLVANTCAISTVNINTNGTFKVSFAYTKEIGTVVLQTTGSDLDYAGNFAITNNSIRLCEGTFCEDYELNETQDKLILTIDNRNTPGCLETWEFLRS